MFDINHTAGIIEHDALAAQHGDAKALSALKTELRALSPDDLKQVANKIQSDMGKSPSEFLSGVDISRDKQGNVMSLEFNPSVIDRVQSRMHGGEAHSVNITVTVVDNVNAPPEMVHRAQEAFNHLPLAVRQLLLKHHEEIVTADTLPDAGKAFWSLWLTEHLKPHPRGYDPKATWDNTSAFQDGQKIVMARHYKFMGDGKTYVDGRIEPTVRHEMGHRVDDLLGMVSDSSEFKKAYEQDIAKIPPEDRAKLDYFLQKEGGRSETFADLFADLNGGGAGTAEQQALMGKYFGNTKAVIQKRLAQL